MFDETYNDYQEYMDEINDDELKEFEMLCREIEGD